MDPERRNEPERIVRTGSYLSTDQVEALVRGQMEAARALEHALLGRLCRPAQSSNPAEMLGILRSQAYMHLREEDLLLGRLAIRSGYASEEQIRAVLDAQECMFQSTGRIPPRLGELLTGRKILTDQELSVLLEVHLRLKKDAPPAPDAVTPETAATAVREASEPPGESEA